MISRALAIFLCTLAVPAAAQEKVTVGTQQLVSSGALFLADGNGYFKAEGLQVEITAYQSAQDVVKALAAGATDFGIAEFTADAFNLAGKGEIKAVAAAAREKRDYEGNEVVASNAAYTRGLRKFEDLANRPVAITQLGSTQHYQIGQIARAKHFPFTSVTLKPMQSLDAIGQAITIGDVDAAILPAKNARELMVASQVKLIGWISEIDEQQLGALFASAKTIATRRAVVEKFVRAYRRGAADYAAALLRHDRYSKTVLDVKAHAVAATIARYVYPGHSGAAVGAVEASVLFIDARARLDMADIARQVDWYKSQGLVDADVNAQNVADQSFLK